MEKDQAIQILDKFLHYRYNVDPLENVNLMAHRLYVEDNGSYWRLQMSQKENIYRHLELPEYVGGGAFYIDKNDGLIYGIGSSPSINWSEEFINFKNDLPSKVNWRPEMNYYLNCRLSSEVETINNYQQLSCSLENRDYVVKESVLSCISKGIPLENIAVKKVPISTNTGHVLFSTERSMNKRKREFVTISFSGGISGSTAAVNQIKKWNRVNGHKSSDDYYIEFPTYHLSNDLSDWELLMKMWVD